MSLLRVDEPNRCRWHWCPACRVEHPLPDSWTFNGNDLKPTFSPSFRQRFGRDRECHYIITDGRIAYCSDSKHELAGQTIDMPSLPVDLEPPCPHLDGRQHCCCWYDGAPCCNCGAGGLDETCAAVNQESPP